MDDGSMNFHAVSSHPPHVIPYLDVLGMGRRFALFGFMDDTFGQLCPIHHADVSKDYFLFVFVARKGRFLDETTDLDIDMLIFRPDAVVKQPKFPSANVKVGHLSAGDIDLRIHLKNQTSLRIP